MEWGNLNGYVGVPEGHCCYEKGYDDLDITCHGGLTYGGYLLGTTLNEGGYPFYYFGFDCAHAGDFMPYMKMGLFKDYPTVYRDMEYVTKECKSIARQLYEMEKRVKKNEKV